MVKVLVVLRDMLIQTTPMTLLLGVVEVDLVEVQLVLEMVVVMAVVLMEDNTAILVEVQ